MSSPDGGGAEARQVALGYEPSDATAGRVWIASGVTHGTVAVSQAFKSRLIAALL
jgi:hypothetical protein